ncbi:hypothetical protein B0H13DRAFT_2271227 [Mycena leptocephala]|nr:hypothetical protein B0H13DRAFT_2271227 [Mycena leptocephala]
MATTNSLTQPSADELKLVEVCANFLCEIANLTPGKSLEAKLNRDYGPSSETYQQLSELALRGLRDVSVVAEGNEIDLDDFLPNRDGLRIKRLPAQTTDAHVLLLAEEQSWLSITAVYMETEGEQVFAGQYHAHPYGEINCSLPVPGTGPNPELEGLDGFGVGLHDFDYPKPFTAWMDVPRSGIASLSQSKGGGLIALFLPAGRISYNATPDMPQPADPGSLQLN